MAHRVAVVLTDRPGDQIEALARDQHVWVIRTATHEAVAEREWASNPRPGLEAGITLFNGGEGTPENELLSILGAIEEHHGEYSHDPPLSIIEVIGAAVTPDVRDELVAFGFSRWQESADGFVAYRE